MLQRRKFIKQTTAAATAGLLLSKNVHAFFELKDMPPVGLQLFTFFNIIDEDVPGTLKKIADIGYKEMESAFSKKGGYYGMQATAFKSLVESLGMAWRSHHVLGAPFKLPPGSKMPTDASGKPITIPPMKNLKDNMQELVDDVAAVGLPFLVCANTPISTTEDIKSSIEVLQKTGEACKKAGIQFCYHNHDAEFKMVDGKVPYEMMLNELDKDNVKFELDLAWAIKGGVNPVDLFNHYPGRFPLWHVKDLDAGRENIMPVGEGTIDFKPIFAAASTAGMQHFFVEHDMPKDAYASITASIANLKKMLA
ncbi:sugar phosphate isomerase/epimerase family protein [Parafilimonas sp.]|uniref:sugar phosphate isomerase/epimerase family protein n=1 Tax=Parafilimonas sp. TaxID=1969739 RepID=UPI0039E3CE89